MFIEIEIETIGFTLIYSLTVILKFPFCKKALIYTSTAQQNCFVSQFNFDI